MEVPFRKTLNVLIGDNDSGKTAIIDAIKLVLDTHSAEWVRIVPEDFHKDTTRLRIECRFEGLRDDEAMHFTEWLGMEGEGKDARPYLRVMLDASKKANERLHYEIRAGADDEGHRLAEGARDYLRVTYLKPLRDAKAELIPRRNSRLSQILSGHAAFKEQGEQRHVLEDVSRCLDCLFQKYFKKEHKDTKCERQKGCPFEDLFYKDKKAGGAGKAIRESIQQMLNEFLGNEQYSADFGVVGRELRNILEQFKLSLSDEELGLGSQNLLFIAAELVNLKRENWTGLRLGLIEELEAHLHPQGQMRVIEYFQRETGKQGGAKDVQVIVTTHSPNLGSKVKLKNLLICHNATAFPMGAKYTKLEKSDYRFLERFLDVTKANLFFAKGVILVEGPSEELILPVLARKAGIDLTKEGVAVVNVGSTAFLRYARIFERRKKPKMKIRVAVITDLDVKPDQEKDKDAGKRTKKEVRTTSKEEKYNGQCVKTFVSPHWTLEYCIARNERLAPCLFRAIQRAILEMNNDGKSISPVEGDYRRFAKGESQEEIAMALYKHLILQKRISKAIIAQHFARIVERNNIAETELNDEDSTKYLVDAIKYVTKQDTDK